MTISVPLSPSCTVRLSRSGLPKGREKGGEPGHSVKELSHTPHSWRSVIAASLLCIDNNTWKSLCIAEGVWWARDRLTCGAPLLVQCHTCDFEPLDFQSFPGLPTVQFLIMYRPNVYRYIDMQSIIEHHSTQ